MMKTMAIIPAAGAGVRMGTKQAKQFLDFCGKPLLAMTLEKFQVCASIDGVILVVPSHDVEYCQKEIIDRYRLNKVEKVVAGGERRQDSVRKGLMAIEGRCKWVLIHDGVRPFIESFLIEAVVKSVKKERAVITALPAKETVKKVDADGFIIKTYDRKQVYLVQTPQAFQYDDIMTAHQKAFLEAWDEVTDDALLVEKMGVPVKVITGSENNIKVTTPHDLELVRFLMGKR